MLYRLRKGRVLRVFGSWWSVNAASYSEQLVLVIFSDVEFEDHPARFDNIKPMHVLSFSLRMSVLVHGRLSACADEGTCESGERVRQYTHAWCCFPRHAGSLFVFAVAERVQCLREYFARNNRGSAHTHLKPSRKTIVSHDSLDLLWVAPRSIPPLSHDCDTQEQPTKKRPKLYTLCTVGTYC